MRDDSDKVPSLLTEYILQGEVYFVLLGFNNIHFGVKLTGIHRYPQWFPPGGSLMQNVMLLCCRVFSLSASRGLARRPLSSGVSEGGRGL